MSKGKKTVAHKVLDDLVKFQTALITDVGLFKNDVLKAMKDVVAAVSEVQTKHNELAAHIVAVESLARNAAGFAVSELGKMGGSVQRHLYDLDKTTNAIDLNVLALAELSKEVIGQLTQVDVLFSRLHASIDTVFSHSGAFGSSDVPSKLVTYGEIRDGFKKVLELAESDVREVKDNAEKWYNDLVAAAFKTVRARMEADDVARKEKAAEEAKIAKEAAMAAEADSTEAKTIKDELKNAVAADLAVASSTSGGQGSPFPDGAEIFGG